MIPSLTPFSVSEDGRARMPPTGSCSNCPINFNTSERVMQSLAASCTNTQSSALASPSKRFNADNTESALSFPPSATRIRGLSAKGRSGQNPSSRPNATTTADKASTLSKRSNVCCKTGLPDTGRYCFGMFAPMRLPTPAAGTTPQKACLRLIVQPHQGFCRARVRALEA